MGYPPDDMGSALPRTTLDIPMPQTAQQQLDEAVAACLSAIRMLRDKALLDQGAAAAFQRFCSSIHALNLPRPTPPVPPPLRIEIKGWLTHKVLTLAEAEQYWLKKAAELIDTPAEQAQALEQAAHNRAWRKAEHPPVPNCERCQGTGDYAFHKRGTSDWRHQPPCPCRFRPMDDSSVLMAGRVKL